MAELDDSLARMNFMQLLLLFAFVTSYVLAIGGLVGPVSRQRFALLAVALLWWIDRRSTSPRRRQGFGASTDPWVNGALLVAFVVAGLGLFVLLTWLLAWWLGPRRAASLHKTPADTLSPASLPVPSSADAASPSPKLPGSARAVP